MDLSPQFIVDGCLWYLVFIISTSAHEAGHAWVARLGGDPTASRGGQVTLNPTPHIRREPIGMVLVPIISFFAAKGTWMMGWATAPYDPYWAMRHPKRAALMSLAGPAADFVLAAIAFLILKIGLGAGWFEVPSLGAGVSISTLAVGEGMLGGVAKFLSIMLGLNVLLGIFNLIPVPPLDGHAVVPLFLSEKGAETWRDWMRTIGFMGIVLAWLLLHRIWPPVFEFVFTLLHPGYHFA